MNPRYTLRVNQVRHLLAIHQGNHLICLALGQAALQRLAPLRFQLFFHQANQRVFHLRVQVSNPLVFQQVSHHAIPLDFHRVSHLDVQQVSPLKTLLAVLPACQRVCLVKNRHVHRQVRHLDSQVYFPLCLRVLYQVLILLACLLAIRVVNPAQFHLANRFHVLHRYHLANLLVVRLRHLLVYLLFVQVVFQQFVQVKIQQASLLQRLLSNLRVNQA